MPTSNSFFKLVSNSVWKEGGPSYNEGISGNPGRLTVIKTPGY